MLTDGIFHLWILSASAVAAANVIPSSPHSPLPTFVLSLALGNFILFYFISSFWDG